jgi:leucyl-tRNA synthetase
VQKHADSGAAGEIDVAAMSAAQKDLRRKTHQTIAKISDDIGRRYTFNTAVAASMELLNAINKFDDATDSGRAVEREALEAVVLMLSPMVPHICHELWSVLGHQTTLIDVPWPTFDEQALVTDLVEVVLQVNGKLRARISVAADADNDSVAALALADPNVQKHIGDKEIRKTIVVPGRLVNIVV